MECDLHSSLQTISKQHNRMKILARKTFSGMQYATLVTFHFSHLIFLLQRFFSAVKKSKTNVFFSDSEEFFSKTPMKYVVLCA